MAETLIHPSAIVEKGCELGRGVKVGPYCVLGRHVRVEDDSEIASHVVIEGRTTIGKNNKISAFVSLGSKPQDLKYRGEDTELVIGSNNMIREYCNISLGTVTGTAKTVIGSNNLFMVYTHVAHDCIIGNDTIIANGVAIAGHVEVGDQAVIGGLAGIHQFCKIGRLAMIAGGSMVAQDVPPYCMVHGDRARPNGLNIVGLKRSSTTMQQLSGIKEMYRIVYSENLTLDEAMQKIENDVAESEYKLQFLKFLRASERGICR